MVLKRTNSNDPDFLELVQQLDAEFWERYGAIQAGYAPHNVLPFLETVVMGYDETTRKAIACGCFKPFNATTAEIKRMFVLREFRGRGYSRRVLFELERWAFASGYTSTILETATGQPEAIGLYTSCGYKQIPNYGPYIDKPLSLCFSKKLGADA